MLVSMVIGPNREAALDTVRNISATHGSLMLAGIDRDTSNRMSNDRSLIPKELLSDITIAGGVDDCANEIKALESLGVNRLYLCYAPKRGEALDVTLERQRQILKDIAEHFL